MKHDADNQIIRQAANPAEPVNGKCEILYRYSQNKDCLTFSGNYCILSM